MTNSFFLDFYGYKQAFTVDDNGIHFSGDAIKGDVFNLAFNPNDHRDLEITNQDTDALIWFKVEDPVEGDLQITHVNKVFHKNTPDVSIIQYKVDVDTHSLAGCNLWGWYCGNHDLNGIIPSVKIQLNRDGECV